MTNEAALFQIAPAASWNAASQVKSRENYAQKTFR